jgi:hypothetical protein
MLASGLASNTSLKVNMSAASTNGLNAATAFSAYSMNNPAGQTASNGSTL